MSNFDIEKSTYKELMKKAQELNLDVKEVAMDETGEGNKLINLCYSQIASPKYDPFAKKCRGLVVSKEDENLEVVAHAFTRFFNLGEGMNDKELSAYLKSLDINKFSYYEKVDGSLIKFYYYKPLNKWLVGTKGQAICQSKVFNLNNTSDKSFYDLVLEALDLKNDAELQAFCDNEGFDKELTYLFEITSMYNAVVVPHEDTKLWFLGAVNKKTGLVILNPCDLEFKNTLVLKPKKYDFKNVDEAKIFSENLPFSDEGYVIYYDKQPMFKIKSPAYVQVHLMSDKNVLFGENPVVRLIFLGELDEYLTYFKDHVSRMLPYNEAKEMLYSDVTKGYFELRKMPFENRKLFSEYLQKEPLFKHAYFYLKNLDEKGILLDSLIKELNVLYPNFSSKFELDEFRVNSKLLDDLDQFLKGHKNEIDLTFKSDLKDIFLKVLHKEVDHYLNVISTEKGKIKLLLNYMDSKNLERPLKKN